jgi:hypothetical protein
MLAVAGRGCLMLVGIFGIGSAVRRAGGGGLPGTSAAGAAAVDLVAVVAAAAGRRRRRRLLVRRRRRLWRRWRLGRLVMGLSMTRLVRILKHRWLDETDTRRALDDAGADRLEQRVAAANGGTAARSASASRPGCRCPTCGAAMRRASVP